MTWQAMESAPRDCPIVVYAPGRDGLRAIASICQWHPDAGFCIDEIREPEYWCRLPVSTQEEISAEKDVRIEALEAENRDLLVERDALRVGNKAHMDDNEASYLRYRTSIEALKTERDTHKHDSQRFRTAASDHAINLNFALAAVRDGLREIADQAEAAIAEQEKGRADD